MESTITTVLYDAAGDRHDVATPRLPPETRVAWMGRHLDDIAAAVEAFPLPSE